MINTSSCLTALARFVTTSSFYYYSDSYSDQCQNSVPAQAASVVRGRPWVDPTGRQRELETATSLHPFPCYGELPGKPSAPAIV